MKANNAFIQNYIEIEVNMLKLVEKTSRHSSHPKRQKKRNPGLFAFRPLSTEELCQLNLATFREGVNHCRWPREVIEQFLAVQV